MVQIGSAAAFTQYLKVVNEAMGLHRKEQPWKVLFDMGGKIYGDKRIGVAMYDTQADQPHDYFTLSFDKDSGTFEMEEHGKAEPDIEWKLPESHVREVIENPEPYKKNPAKLDLDWMAKRLRS